MNLLVSLALFVDIVSLYMYISMNTHKTPYTHTHTHTHTHTWVVVINIYVVASETCLSLSTAACYKASHYSIG